MSNTKIWVRGYISDYKFMSDLFCFGCILSKIYLIEFLNIYKNVTSVPFINFLSFKTLQFISFFNLSPNLLHFAEILHFHYVFTSTLKISVNINKLIELLFLKHLPQSLSVLPGNYLYWGSAGEGLG